MAKKKTRKAAKRRTPKEPAVVLRSRRMEAAEKRKAMRIK